MLRIIISRFILLVYHKNLRSLILIFAILSTISVINADPEITISTGTLLGKESTNENGKVYHSYQGIPYAKPPLGNLRFKPPQNPESWSGVRNATFLGSNCRQFDIFFGVMSGTEDCLFLNVYVPQQTNNNKPLPVMFWIHGGGFNFGDGGDSLYGPGYLMDHDVILVTSNYRLGPFGQLNLEIEEAPGNAGLKDNVAALKWVQQNIAAFGGDPKSVTIFGESSGGSSVHYLVLSDSAKGLFHKAIAQSGSALNPYAFQRNHLERAFELCSAMGHPTSDPEDALRFLQQAPMESFHEAKLSPMISGLVVNNYVFTPSVEKRFPGQESFLTETPLEKLKSGKFNKVPYLTGINSGEGIFFFIDLKYRPGLFDELEADFERFVPKDLRLPKGSEDSKKLAKDMRKFYFNDQKVSNETRKYFVDLTSDTWFLRGVDDNVRFTVENSEQPVFYYEFTFPEFGMFKNFIGGMGVDGVSHADEIGYLFTNVIEKFPKELPNAVKTRQRMLTMWTNFAKTGNPTPEINDLLPVKWEPVTKDKLNYLTIDKDLTMGTNPQENRLKFWENWKPT